MPLWLCMRLGRTSSECLQFPAAALMLINVYVRLQVALLPAPLPLSPLVIVVAFQCRILSHIIIIIASNGALWSSKWFARGAEGNSRCQDNAQQAQQKGQLDCYF